jgi:hypothetical protein
MRKIVLIISLLFAGVTFLTSYPKSTAPEHISQTAVDTPERNSDD